VSTWELLRTLGFAEKGRKLHFKLGDLQLEASQVWNERLAPVVFLGGLYRSPRAIGMVADDLPHKVESREATTWSRGDKSSETVPPAARSSTVVDAQVVTAKVGADG
jgi:hypothetical protein